MISQDTIDKVVAANDIVEVIGTYFPLKRAGSSFKALCPFHQEKSPSFIVNPARQTYHCFGCGAGGGVLRFVMEYENVDFPAAVRRMADRAGIPIVEDHASPAADENRRARDRLLALHQAAAAWFHRNLMKSEAGTTAREYLQARGVNTGIARNWQLGYAPDSWDALLNWARAENFTEGELLTAGLCTPRDADDMSSGCYDRFRHRVMFPICNDIGEVIAFSGRVLAPDPKSAKYVNSPETPLFRKGEILFGLHRSKRAIIEKRQAIVCEGQLDLISLFEAGIQNVVAPQGTAFTPKQAMILRRFADEVLLCFDSDKAGQTAAERSFAALLEANLDVRIVEVPPGEDPDSLVRSQGADAFNALVKEAKDYFDCLLERELGGAREITPRLKTEVAKRLASAASLVEDPVLRDSIVGRISSRIGIPQDEFRNLVRRGAPASSARGGQPAPQPARPASRPDNTLCWLIVLACRRGNARAWLLGQDWKSLREQVPEADLLWKILAAGIRPDVEGSLTAFMSSLPRDEEEMLAAILHGEFPDNENTVSECWNALMRRFLASKRDAARSRLRAPDLTAEDMARFQKEILDLQNQLNDIGRLSPVKPSPH